MKRVELISNKIMLKITSRNKIIVVKMYLINKDFKVILEPYLYKKTVVTENKIEDEINNLARYYLKNTKIDYNYIKASLNIGRLKDYITVTQEPTGRMITIEKRFFGDSYNFIEKRYILNFNDNDTVDLMTNPFGSRRLSYYSLNINRVLANAIDILIDGSEIYELDDDLKIHYIDHYGILSSYVLYKGYYTGVYGTYGAGEYTDYINKEFYHNKKDKTCNIFGYHIKINETEETIQFIVTSDFTQTVESDITYRK